MSQVTQVPPPPIGPSSKHRYTIWYAVFAAALIVALLIGFESRVLNSAGGKEAALKILQDPRVRAEFGDDVHIPFAFAWDTGDEADIYAYIGGKQAHGYAFIDLYQKADDWRISRLEVYDRTERHLIHFAQPDPPARPEDLHGFGTLYFVALGEGANADVAELADFFRKRFGIQSKILPPMSLPTEAYNSLPGTE